MSSAPSTHRTDQATAPLFPLFVDLRERRVLVVGGGHVAARKIDALLRSGALVCVLAPEFAPEVEDLSTRAAIELQRGEFSEQWLEGVWLVIAATDDGSVNQAVADAAEQRQIWCNVVDTAALCSAQLPARVSRGPLQIAISSGGHAPMLARHLRERFERELDPAWSDLADLLAKYRGQIRARWPELGQRRAFFESVLGGEVLARLHRGQAIEAEALLVQQLAAVEARSPRSGRVILVGAGPGDAGLITLRGLRALNQADVILHDRLVSDEVLALARRDAWRIEVGKESGRHHVTQEQIHHLMREHARAGRVVVRLKGGDGFVFGRGGEELQFLRAQGIDYEVVPGITAALACAAYAGIPLTHREHAQSLRLVTAHCRSQGADLDWHSLAQTQQTLAFYMGVAALDTVQSRLIEHGADPALPCALVENGSRGEQRVVLARLDGIAQSAQRHAVRSPALLLVGEVAALAAQLHWFGAPPIDDRDRCAQPALAAAA